MTSVLGLASEPAFYAFLRKKGLDRRGCLAPQLRGRYSVRTAPELQRDRRRSSAVEQLIRNQ